MQKFDAFLGLGSLKFILLRWLQVGIVFLTFFSLAGYWGKFHLLFELISHFKVQYLVQGNFERIRIFTAAPPKNLADPVRLLHCN